MERIKVLQYPGAFTNKYGGIARHCFNLSSLFENDTEVEILPIKTDFIRKGYTLAGQTIYDWGDLRKYILETDYDIIHIHGCISYTTFQALKIATKNNKRIVYSPHFHPFKYLRRPLAGNIFFKLLIQPYLRGVKETVTISHTDTDFFSKYATNINMIPHHYNNVASKHEYIERRKKMLLFVGRNESNKGIDSLYKLPSDYEVHCVTHGELRRSDFIQYLDISDQELSNLYSQASAVVIPSRYEAFSYVALEAFAHSTPVVMSDHVRIADYVAGKSGVFIYPYGNQIAFEEAISKAVSSSADCKDLLRPFDPEVVKNEYKRVYFKALK